MNETDREFRVRTCQRCYSDSIYAFTRTSAEFLFCEPGSHYMRDDERGDDIIVNLDDYDVIEEECDCGLQVRHNDGGNYHYRYYTLRQAKRGRVTP